MRMTNGGSDKASMADLKKVTASIDKAAATSAKRKAQVNELQEELVASSKEQA